MLKRAVYELANCTSVAYNFYFEMRLHFLICSLRLSFEKKYFPELKHVLELRKHSCNKRIFQSKKYFKNNYLNLSKTSIVALQI